MTTYIAACQDCGYAWEIEIRNIDQATEETAGTVCPDCESSDWVIE